MILCREEGVVFTGACCEGEKSGKRRILHGECSKGRECCLVIISEDASANTKKLFTDKCSFYEVPIYTLGTKEMLGKAIGKEMRASLAVTDPGLSDSIMKHLQTIQE